MDAKKDSGERQKLEESESFKTTQSQLTPGKSTKASSSTNNANANANSMGGFNKVAIHPSDESDV